MAQLSGSDLNVRISTKSDTKGIEETESKLGRLKSMTAQAAGASRAFAGGLLALGAATAGAVTVGARYAGQLESMQIALETVTGSSKDAERAMATIKRVAAESPFFETQTLASFVQLMAASGQAIDEAVDSALGFGDVAAAFGKGNAEMTRMGNTLSQVIGKGKADVIDLRELVNAGWVSVRTDVAETMGVTMAQLEEMVSAGEVGYEDIRKAAEKFTGSADKQSRTFGALTQRMGESFQNFLADLVVDTGAFDLLKNAMEGVVNFLDEHGEEIGRGIRNFIQWSIDNWPILAGIIVGGLVPAFVALAGSIVAATAPLLPFIAAGAAIGAVWQSNLGGIQDKAKGLYDVLVKGDFTKRFAQAFNVHEDSELVDFLLNVREGLLNVGGGLKAIYDLLVGGDFTAEFHRIFQLPEDSPVVDLLFRLRESFINLWDALSTNLLPALQELWTAVSPVLIPALKFLGGVALALVIAQIKATVEFIIVLANAASALARGVAATAQGVVNAFTWIGERIEWFKNLIGAFPGFIGSVVDGITKWFQELPGRVGTYLNELFFERIPFAIGYAAGYLYTAIPELINRTVSWFQQLPGRVGQAFTDLVNGVARWTNETGTALVRGVQAWMNRAGDSAKSGANNLVNAIASIIFQLPGRLSSLAQALGGAIGDAIRNIPRYLGDVFSWASNIISGIGKAIHDKAGVLSGAFKAGWEAAGAPGFQMGGFTGLGPANQPAGIVHKGEYVLRRDQVDQSTGLPKSSMGQTINFNQYNTIHNDVDLDAAMEHAGHLLAFRI